jgi:hypothetical protein
MRRTHAYAVIPFTAALIASLVGSSVRAEECGPLLITQSVNLTAMSGSAATVCMAVGDSSGDNSVARGFVVGDQPILVSCVDFGIELNFGDNWPVEARIYSGLPSQPAADLVFIRSGSVTISGYTQEDLVHADFSPPVALPARGSFTVELHSATRDAAAGGDGGILVFGFNALGQSAPSYFRSTTCGTGEFHDLAAMGFTNSHLLLGVHADIDESSCPADLNGDGNVDGADLASLLGAWGSVASVDLNASGAVDAADLSLLLGAWGACG